MEVACQIHKLESGNAEEVKVGERGRKSRDMVLQVEGMAGTGGEVTGTGFRFKGGRPTHC